MRSSTFGFAVDHVDSMSYEEQQRDILDTLLYILQELVRLREQQVILSNLIVREKQKLEESHERELVAIQVATACRVELNLAQITLVHYPAIKFDVFPEPAPPPSPPASIAGNHEEVEEGTGLD